MRRKLLLLAFFSIFYSWSQTTNTFTNNGSFVVAAGLTSLTAECWGAGGSGGGNDTSTSAGGGGGGGYSKATITITPNTTINYLVGVGPTGNTASGVSGPASTFSTVSANGGGGGTSGTGGAAGIGGAAGTGTTFSGGKGSNGSVVIGLLYSGGAGGGAGTASNGNDAAAGGGGAAVTGGGAGGNGATLAGNGANGATPGGGGGGGLVLLGIGNNKGGNGGNGQIKITYTCPTYGMTGATGSNACATDGNSTITVSGSAANLPVGTYTVTYNRSNPALTGLTATMTVGTAGTGTFTAVGLANIGTSAITITAIASGTCSSTISTTNVANVTIFGASAGGSVGGGTTICSGLTSASLSLTGQTGTIVKWQYSVTPFSAWTDIASTAGLTAYTSGVLTQTTQFRAVVQNGPCSISNSNFTTVTVNALPSAPVIGTITLPTCAVPTGTVALSGLPSGGVLTMYPGAIVKPYSGTTANVTGLSANTYTFTVSNGSCTSLVSTNALVTGLVTNTYTTSWSNGTPSADQNIIFAGNYTSAGAGAGDITACSCTVNSGVNVSIQSFDTLTLTNALTNNGGTVTFQNSSSLLQNTTAVNVGNIVYKRTASNVRLADFVYWSTPVNPQKLVDVSPLTLYDKYFAFDGTNWVGTNANLSMVIGKGYIIRGPQTYSTTVGADYTASFIGVPNNGNVSAETVQTGNLYLVGNPYPSALKAETFLGANTFLDGTLYFWTHNTAAVFGPNYQYNSGDYASYNLSGGVGTAPAPTGSIPGNNNNTPSGRIAAGQSFFVTANSPGTIAFTNAMRIGGNTNGQFFKASESSKETEVAANRIWLNMTNEEGAFKQLLVAYVDGATNDFENRYDGISFDANPYLDFYSVSNENNYVIQGRSLPFIDTDQVPLGYRSTITGDFTIAIDHAEGGLSNHAIYLEDKETNVIHDLQASNYTFSTGTGTFSDRFVLRYSNSTLGVIDNELINQDLTVSVSNKIVTINAAENENLSTVFVYDLSGKLIYKKTNISDNILIINNLKVNNQVLFVKVISDDNKVTTKKIIY
ncbi:T9SS sorting signal type C domain-containing protein [Flavobacterium aquidurense]|uniref:RTX toxins and related Ca2+-binding protein n=1 Tax=Flavobacterium aquidurense TaxID=362413 RepID=A0A0N8VN45_9FLAO|nr:T9SS sorting signal type C domain-containing protein [Flavobacterium aquidurense]KQB41100.1 RTX toxins and related Ca2+-binding protein [Flavobacterium aquidurense]